MISTLSALLREAFEDIICRGQQPQKIKATESWSELNSGHIVIHIINNYVDKIKGGGGQTYLFLATLRVKNKLSNLTTWEGNLNKKQMSPEFLGQLERWL